MALTVQQAAAKVEQLTKRIRDRSHDLTTLQEYFDGEHGLAFASDEWATFHKNRYHDFSDNWCGVVARAAAERTELFGMRWGSDADVQSDDEKRLWDDWVTVDGPAKSAQGFLTGTVQGSSYALVWRDPSTEGPSLSWEIPTQVIVDYDPEYGHPRYALKLWSDDDNDMATLYAADELWKFERPKQHENEYGLILPDSMLLVGDWTPRGDKPNISNPLGALPIVEFPNRPVLGKGPISDISGVKAMQDAVNLMWAYLFSAADFASLPARVVLGAERPMVPILDDSGQVTGKRPVEMDDLKAGRMLWLTSTDASIGQWDAAKLEQFTEVVNVLVKHVASQTQTPIHYIMGELGNVNGETLTATELPLATKVRQGHKFLATPMRRVFALMAQVRGNGEVADQIRSAVAQWKNPETMSDAQVSDAATKDKAVGWPFAATLERRYGLSQPEIQRVMQQREHEAVNDPELQLARDLAGSGTAPSFP